MVHASITSGRKLDSESNIKNLNPLTDFIGLCYRGANQKTFLHYNALNYSLLLTQEWPGIAGIKGKLYLAEQIELL